MKYNWHIVCVALGLATALRADVQARQGACSSDPSVPSWEKMQDAKNIGRQAEIVGDAGDLGRAELAVLLDSAEREYRDQPYIVAKTKMLRLFLENVRVMVRADDTFVDMVADSGMIVERRDSRCRDFGMRTVGLEETTNGWHGTHGAFVSHLDPSHTCPDWESILRLGFTGLAGRARQRLSEDLDDRERTFLSCVVETYEAIARFCDRWALAAEQRGAMDCATVLRALARREPRSFREALQMMLVYNRMQEIEGDYVRSQGLFDRLYIEFYRDDIARGRETRASAKKLIRALFDKFYLQAHPNGNNIGFGGYGRDGVPVWNELTELAFELHDELNRSNPKLSFRFGERTPEEQLLKVCRCIAAGRTSVVFFNDDLGCEMFLRRGKTPEDVADAVLIGCYEPGIMGREAIASMGGWLNMARPLEAVFNGGRGFDGYRIGPECALPANYAEFEAEYLRQLEALTRRMLHCTATYERNGRELNPSPVFSGCMRDCVANARDAYDGGCKYNQTGIMCAGMATVADSLAAVRWLVDEQKAVTMSELAEILKHDWSGNEELRLRARREAPKWGNNDDRVDLLGKKVFDFLSRLVNAAPNGHGGTFQAGFWSIDDDVRLGAYTGATPEGRKAGEAISRNNVATAGCGKEGATALVLTNAKVDQADAPDGYILDVILPATTKDDGVGAGRIAAFLRAFAAKGGQSVHFNVFNSQVLRDAQAHPERYEDLQVRVCGWNVRWNDLSKVEQDHFIATAEAQE